MQRIGLKELASHLNVSVSTVCKSLRDSHEIGVDTKKRVQEVAKELGYIANPYAAHLRIQKSRTIAVVVPELTNNFFIQAINGVEEYCRSQNYHALVYVTNENFTLEKAILNQLMHGRVDGVILSLSAQTKSHDHIMSLIDSGIPVVFFDRVCHEIETVKVITNDFASALLATEHLVENGCKEIAFLSLSANLSIDNKRKQGYLESLLKHDLPIQENRIIDCAIPIKKLYRVIKQLLSSPNRPDGIFASVEKLALVCYRVCHELNLSIPDDIKIICFSNLESADLLSPSLTTISQPAFDIGKQASIMLLKYLSKKKAIISNENIIIPSTLIARASTKKGKGFKIFNYQQTQSHIQNSQL